MKVSRDEAFRSPLEIEKLNAKITIAIKMVLAKPSAKGLTKVDIPATLSSARITSVLAR